MQHVHFLGIGGSGASAVASIAQAQGYKITGCDIVINNEFTEGFSQDQLFEGHAPDHLEGVDILAVTPAIFSQDPENPELLAAKEKGIEVLTWQEFMGKFLEKDKFVIAVCGTHGKSTTTAMIGLMLEEVGLDPTVELGAIVPKWNKNFRIGKSKYFVTEADEFNNNFLATIPDIAVVNNIEFDHPEFFPDFESYKQSFVKFLRSTNQVILANMSNQGVRDVILGGNSDGLTERSNKSFFSGAPEQSQKNDIASEADPKNIMQVINFAQHPIDFPLQVPGDFNKLNATAVFEVGNLLKIDPEIIKKSLSDFSGTSRRLELVGKYRGGRVYSDFGHHPTELKVTFQALKDKFPKKDLVVIFQPHMFSRTKALFDDFVKVFQESPVSEAFIADIYPSREVDTGLVSSKQLVEAIELPNDKYVATGEDILKILKSENHTKNILLFIGAGDTDKWAKQLISAP